MCRPKWRESGWRSRITVVNVFARRPSDSAPTLEGVVKNTRRRNKEYETEKEAKEGEEEKKAEEEKNKEVSICTANFETKHGSAEGAEVIKGARG